MAKTLKNEVDFEKEISERFPKLKFLKSYKAGYIKWVECECPEHGAFAKRWLDLLKSKDGCPKCSFSKINEKRYLKPFSDFLDKAEEVHGDKYIYPQKEAFYEKEKIEIICKTHGKFIQAISSHLKGAGCPKCASIERAKSVRLSKEEIVERLKGKIGGENYDYSETGQTESGKIKIICRSHGEFYVRPLDFLNGHGCLLCSRERTRKKEEEKFKSVLLERYKNRIKFPSQFNYVNSHTKVKVLLDDEIIEREPHTILRDGLLSKKEREKSAVLCGIRRSKNRWKDILEEFRKIHGDRYEYGLSEIEQIKNGEIGSRDRLHITCKKHGEFIQTFAEHRYGHGCKKCGIENRPFVLKVSKQEKELQDFIKSIYDGEVICNDRNILNGKELDVYIPELELAIEYDGLYWHDGIDNSVKFEECRKKGIRLIQIMEWEWLKRKRKVKKFLEDILLETNDIPFEKCEIRSVDYKTYRKFCEDNSLEGYKRAPIKLGIFCQGKLYQMMSFDKIKGGYDIVENCARFGYSIIDGTKSLLKYFEENYRPKKVVFSCNKGKTNPSEYLRLGFEIDKEEKPCYTYYKRSRKVSKGEFQKVKKELFDPNLSETENMERLGFTRLYDYGRYILKRSGK